MSGQHLEFAQRWLTRADHDVITAQQTLLLESGPTDTPCFHAQQAIEKALKALLTGNQVVFPKTHDLLRLLDLTLPLLPELELYREQFADMESYAVDIRYPDWGFDPSREEALASLALAEAVITKIRATLAVL